MDLQKPTVLDAARAANELNRLRGGIIAEVKVSLSTLSLYMEVRNPDIILKYTIEKKYASIAQVADIENSELKSVQQFAGYEITESKQIAGDRIIAIELKKEDRLGRSRQTRLIFELIPNKGNCVLLDETGNLKWGMRKVDKYSFPSPLKQATILNIDCGNLIHEIQNPSDLNTLYGLNQRDVINLEIEKCRTIEEAVTQLSDYAFKASKPGPAWLIYKGETLQGYSLASPRLENGERAEKCNSALEMYAAYYELALRQSSKNERYDELTGRLEKAITHARGKLVSLEKELISAEKASSYRFYGELILTHIDKVHKGRKSILLEDEEIELDPSRTPSANAEEYFKRYKKAQSSINMINRRIESAKSDIEKLERVRWETYDNLDDLEAALEKLGLLPKKALPGKKIIQARRLPYKKFVASNGWEIWVGRTNNENDELSLKLAHKDDYWFHAWQAAGSHVVLRLPNKTAIPDKQILLEAASLAAYYSKAKTSSKVPIAYTQAKYVRKPKGFPPGQVLIEKEKQLMVKPANPDDFLPKIDSEDNA